MNYGIHERDYLERAKARITEGHPEALFYAAVELRCAIEARQSHYLDAQRDYLASIPPAWQIRGQGQALKKVFRSDKIQSFLVDFGGARKVPLFYTPVTNSLRQMADQMDQYRHAQLRFHANDDPWWDVFRSRLLKTYRKAWIATRGNLLSPAILNNKTEKPVGNLMIEIRAGQEFDRDILKQLVGEKMMVHVSYLDHPPPDWECDL